MKWVILTVMEPVISLPSASVLCQLGPQKAPKGLLPSDPLKGSVL